ncbi:MAG: 4a-hydroxytetrahydrobiopterin dehydratase [Verrucomicrobia bacterium]|nr:4a-hydroxytetrahydrobiopterin dehydratase [Verrucomicrobiota bacterium]
MTKLKPAEIKRALRSVRHWTKRGRAITRTYTFKDFVAAMKFVNAAARVAERAWHHPDIDIRWNQVTLTLSTHDAGGLTEKDFALAAKFDAAAK